MPSDTPQTFTHESEPFDSLDRTIRLRSQTPVVDDDLKTLMIRPPVPAESPAAAEKMARLEAKIDVLTRAVEVMLRRIEAMDDTVRRAIARLP